MSDQVSPQEPRSSHVRSGPAGTAVVRARSLVLLLTAFIIVLGLAVLGADGVLISVSAALARLVDIDWPRWIHNLADMLQIVTILFALLVWGSTRRGQ